MPHFCIRASEIIEKAKPIAIAVADEIKRRSEDGLDTETPEGALRACAISCTAALLISEGHRYASDGNAVTEAAFDIATQIIENHNRDMAEAEGGEA